MSLREDISRGRRRDVIALLLLAFGIFGLLAVLSYDYGDVPLLQYPPNIPPHNLAGSVGAWVAFFLFISLGVVAYLIPLAAVAVALTIIFARHRRAASLVIWTVVLLLALACLVELQPELWSLLQTRINLPGPGGIVGFLLGRTFLIRYLGAVGAGVILVGAAVIAALYLFEFTPRSVLSAAGMVGVKVGEGALWLWQRVKRRRASAQARVVSRVRRKVSPPPPEPAFTPARTPATELAQPPDITPPAVKVERRTATRPKRERPKAPKQVALSPVGEGKYRLPPVDLLNVPPPVGQRTFKDDLQENARILQETLAEFGVECKVTNVERGPVVTRYELLPAPGVRVERISSLGNNIALAMKAESVRVQAPVPGKGVVGIEVPNPKTTLVYLREILESDTWQESRAELPLAIGKDVAGRVIVTDLTEMPHLLIAGATGSGKTVCINSLIAGLIMSRTPEQMRLLLIDPKIVEFSVYRDLPHLIVPVVTEAKQVSFCLRWAINEMENRYRLFARAGVRNIQSYNSRPRVKQEQLFPENEEQEEKHSPLPERLPYIVIVIDELADLMLVAQAEIENCIARLAQLSRAVGIHMIIATQRPSVNVITGTIKANLPARIAFQVAQKVDSRTILDANGADKLLGRGDMLFLPPGTSKLIRAQGTLTQDDELSRIVAYYKEQGQPEYETTITEKLSQGGTDLDLEEDEKLIEKAIEIIVQTGRASTSALQRRLRIGYTRAARIMDILEQRGIVGPPRGAEPREILISHLETGASPDDEEEPSRK